MCTVAWPLGRSASESGRLCRGAGARDAVIAAEGCPESAKVAYPLDVEHLTRGRMATPGSPIRLSASSTEVTRPPLLGEHNAEILGKVCGLGAEELAKLKADGVL